MKSPVDLKLTKEGFDNLKDELANLITRRPDVLKRMVEAREQGDLSENAGYHAAREELGYIDSRTRQVKAMLRLADVVDGDGGGTVSFGDTVVADVDGSKMEFKIVSDLEADPAERKMSDKSPIGSALLGKAVGETAVVEIPDGRMKLKVLEIKG